MIKTQDLADATEKWLAKNASGKQYFNLLALGMSEGTPLPPELTLVTRGLQIKKLSDLPDAEPQMEEFKEDVAPDGS